MSFLDFILLFVFLRKQTNEKKHKITFFSWGENDKTLERALLRCVLNNEGISYYFYYTWSIPYENVNTFSRYINMNEYATATIYLILKLK